MSGWTSTTTSGQGYQQYYDQHQQYAYHRGPSETGGGRGQAPIASFEDLSLASFELSPEDRLNRGETTTTGGGKKEPFRISTIYAINFEWSFTLLKKRDFCPKVPRERICPCVMHMLCPKCGTESTIFDIYFAKEKENKIIYLSSFG